MSALSDSLRDLSKGLSTLAVVVGPNHPLVAADPLNESADLFEEAAMTIEGYESKLATITARCAELEGALRGVLSELDRIGNAPATDQCQQHWDVDTETTITVARAALAKVTT